MSLSPTKQVDDVIDYTRQYNLLQREENESLTTFVWDLGVLSATGGDGSYQTYLRDDLGSPIRLLGESGWNEVLAYDEFGQTLQSIKGLENQPFTYTGFQRDEVAETFFAQAREYNSIIGRFASEDIVRGVIYEPLTINQYVYCLNRPMDLVDLDGCIPCYGHEIFAEPEPPEEQGIIWLTDPGGPGNDNNGPPRRPHANPFGHTGIAIPDSNGDWWIKDFRQVGWYYTYTTCLHTGFSLVE